MRERLLSVILVLIMMLQIQLPTELLGNDSEVRSIGVGGTEFVVVGTPGGYNTQVDLEIPSGEVLSGLEMELSPRPLLRQSGIVWDEEADFSTNGVILDSIDHNISEGFTILPDGGSWNFESGSIHSDMTTGGSAQWSVTSSSPLGGSYTAQSGSIGNSQETSLTLTISNLAGTGSFKYRVSSESNYDYLIFCIDNTGCSRYSGYTNRWSGYYSGTYSFTTTASTQTLTWKYTKDGSLSSGSDAGWIDDIEITPSQGSGNGLGNWTSQVFGTGVSGANRLSDGPMGMMSIDAEIPVGSLFMWSLLDADTLQPIPGFSGRSDLNIDLGALDQIRYDRLRLNFQLGSSGSGSPVINSINIGERIVESFYQNPSPGGWDLGGMSHSTGVISGTGTLTTPVLSPVGGVAGFEIDLTATGTVQVEYSLGDDVWESIEKKDSEVFTTLHKSIQFRMICNQASVDHFDVNLPTNNMPSQMIFDVGMDGVAEFGLAHRELGSLGLQSNFADGSISTGLTTSSSDPGVKVFVPEQFTNLGLYLNPKGAILDDVELTINHGNHELLNRNLGMVADLFYIDLSEQEITQITNEISTRTSDKHSYDLNWYELDFRIDSSSNNDVDLSGLNVFWNADELITFNKQSPLIRALTSANEPVIPIKMSSPGSLYLKLNELQSTQSVSIIGMSLSNLTEPLVASEDWLESSASFDFSTVSSSNPLTTGIAEGWKVRLDLVGASASSSVTCDLRESENSQSMSTYCEQDGLPLDWSEGGYGANSSGSVLTIDHRFRLPATWEDEPRLNLEVRVDVGNHLTPAASLTVGQGPLKGVENDLRIVSWTVMNSQGVDSPIDTPAVVPDSQAFAVVDLAFEGMPDDINPRSGDVQVEFFMDGESIGMTEDLVNGRASIEFDTPRMRPHIDLELQVKGLKGQMIYNDTSLERRFKTDSLIPELLSTSAHRYDTSRASESDLFTFMISDAPYLPQHAFADVRMNWRSGDWVRYDLEFVKKHGDYTGEYQLVIDDSDAPDGGLMDIFLEVFDAAGNQMPDSGNATEPLHTIYFTTDGSPLLTNAQLIGASAEWLHPETVYELVIDISDDDGISDIASVDVDLSSGSGEDLVLMWDNQNVCESSNDWIVVLNCSISSLGSVNDPFSSESRLSITFKIDWGFNSDTSMARIPAITIRDRSGQVDITIREEMTWMYSTEIEVDPSSIEVKIQGSILSGEGVFLPPSTPVEVSGNIRWTRDGSIVDALLSTRVILGEEEQSGESDSDGFDIIVNTPSISGSHPLLARLESLPFTAVDRSIQLPIIWFVIDASQPVVRTLISPSRDDVIRESSFDDLRIEVSIEEHERLNLSSMKLHWEVKRSDVGFGAPVLFGGVETLVSIGGRSSGSSIPMGASIPLRENIDDGLRTAALELSIYISGNDVSGQMISDVENNQSSPLAIWDIEQDQPSYWIPVDEIALSKRGTLHIGDEVDATILIQNQGNADGIAEVMVTAVDSEGNRRILGIEDIFIPANQSSEHTVTWIFATQGANWLEIEITGQEVDRGPVLVVENPTNDGMLSSISEEMNPVILSIFILTTLSLVTAIIYSARRRFED